MTFDLPEKFLVQSAKSLYIVLFMLIDKADTLSRYIHNTGPSVTSLQVKGEEIRDQHMSEVFTITVKMKETR